MSPKGRMLPALSLVLTPSRSSALAASVGGAASRSSTDLSPVPASLPWMPASPRIAIDAAASSMLIPAFAATGATNLKASPIIPTVTLPFTLAFANTSTSRPVSSAFIPMPPRMFDTMSADVARSMLAPVASWRIPGVAARISFVLKPAIARKSMALAASVAVNFVVRPSSFA